MFLREYLTKYTKEELLDQARSFEIKKCSGLRKADLIDRIVDTFCAEEMLRSRLACLTKEQIDRLPLSAGCPLEHDHQQKTEPDRLPLILHQGFPVVPHSVLR